MRLQDVPTFEVGEKISLMWGGAPGGMHVVKVEDGIAGWRDGPFDKARRVPMQIATVQFPDGRTQRVPANECLKKEPAIERTT